MGTGLPAEEIGEADGDACPEEGVPTEHDFVGVLALVLVDLALEDDGHDDTVDGDSLAENHTDLPNAYLTKFLDLILGAFTAAPRILAPAMKMPLG